MGIALLLSLLKENVDLFEQYNAFDILEVNIAKFTQDARVNGCASVKDVIDNSDVILLAVKPQHMEVLLKQISGLNISKKNFISIAAGLAVDFYRQILGSDCFITRVMPNTPYQVGAGAAGITIDPKLDDSAVSLIKDIFEAGGKVIICEEKYLDVVTGLSGSGPAYIFVVIEAMADGAVKMGLPRDQAYKLAAQTVLGAAEMVLQTGKHPGELKDMVTSPGGTTIAAISVLENGKLRATLMNAVEASTNKSKSFHS